MNEVTTFIALGMIVLFIIFLGLGRCLSRRVLQGLQ